MSEYKIRNKTHDSLCYANRNGSINYDKIPILPYSGEILKTKKRCYKCHKEKNLIEFSHNRYNKDKLQTHCRSCRRDRMLNNQEQISIYRHKQYIKNKSIEQACAAKYRATKIKATPKWYETNKIEILYKKRNELSKKWNIILHVDHVVPLTNDIVCCLHCWDNLQLIESAINLSKSNKFDDFSSDRYETKHF